MSLPRESGLARASPSRTLGARDVLVIAAIVMLCATWGGLVLARPDWVVFLAGVPGATREGALEIVELAALLACLAAWVDVARKARSRRGALVALAMVAQLALFVLEETDWGGNLGLPHLFEARNLRMTLRGMGMPAVLDPKGFAIILAWFLLSPLVPIPAYRRWWEGAAPVRALPSDAVAILAAVGAYSLTWAIVRSPLVGLELSQCCVYVVLVSATARVWSEVRRS